MPSLLRAPDEKMPPSRIAQGKIVAIGEQIDGNAKTEIDAKGMLVSESFVNPHLHLCKVYTLQMMDEEALKDYHGADMGKAMTAIELAARVKEKYDRSWILPNVRKALAQATLYGCTHIRAFADVDSKATAGRRQGPAPGARGIQGTSWTSRWWPSPRMASCANRAH